ncbi:MAG: hypothetical protein ACK417_05605 [Bacteroidia bacterium]
MPLLAHSTYTLRPDVADVLHSTVYGLPGKLRYRQLDAADKCARIPSTRWLLLEKNGKLLGNAAVLERNSEIASQTVSTAYVRYLSIPGGSQSVHSRAAEPKRHNHIRKMLASELAAQPHNQTPLPRVLFAYVEADNLPSQQLCASFGLRPYRQLRTCISSRFFSRTHRYFRPLHEAEKPFILQQLSKQYERYNFFFPEELFGHGQYFVITNEQDEPLLGCLVFRCDWEIVEMPGVGGWLIKHLFPLMPLLRRLFPKDHLSFAAVEGLWCPPAHTHLLNTLFESCTHQLGLHVSMFWDDADSDVGRMVEKSVRKGLIGHLNQTVHADILMKTWNSNQALETTLHELPVYVSAHDLT